MKRTLAEALQTATQLKQELSTIPQPDKWVFDIIKLAEAINIMYTALQTMADDTAEIPKSVARDKDKSLGDYYEELARETIAIVNGKYERR
jgi:hypothetical protein